MEAGTGRIRAVTLDVGGTLAEGRPDHGLYARRVLHLLASRGFRVGRGEWEGATRKALLELRARREEGREMSFREFSSLQLSLLGVEPSPSLLEEMLSLYLLSFPRRLKRGARRMVEELSPLYLLGALSNSMSPAPRLFLEERGLARHFRVILVSGEVGYRKPHPEIFLRALGELGVSPREAVHVGDRPEVDGAGAKAVGMSFILLSSRTPGEGVEADAVVPSPSEVPGAVRLLSREDRDELLDSLGRRCAFCSSPHFSLYGEEESPLLLCPDCRRSLGAPRAKPRKHGKYRAPYRRSWRSDLR